MFSLLINLFTYQPLMFDLSGARSSVNSFHSWNNLQIRNTVSLPTIPISEYFYTVGAINVFKWATKNTSIIQIFDRAWHLLWSTIMPFLWKQLQARWWHPLTFSVILKHIWWMALSANNFPSQRVFLLDPFHRKGRVSDRKFCPFIYLFVCPSSK